MATEYEYTVEKVPAVSVASDSIDETFRSNGIGMLPLISLLLVGLRAHGMDELVVYIDKNIHLNNAMEEKEIHIQFPANMSTDDDFLMESYLSHSFYHMLP